MVLCGGSLVAAEQPNILWLTVEDIGPHLGCYGDKAAETPELDAFAQRSLLYQNAWSTAPVCAPARTTLISGLYPPSTGSEHMRSMTKLPEGMLMYPNLMRKAGYYCVNPGKEDYNLEKTGKVWDSINKRNPWQELKQKQPFMAVINHTGTHESKIRTRPHEQRLDPKKVRVPAHHPDTPEVRRDWAQYLDNIHTMDGWFASQLKRLKDAGLSENTIVFFYGDHGSGMPRHKRWTYNSGLQVPLIVYVPEKFRSLAPKDYAPGAKTDRIVGFIDLAPTVISLAGAKPPETMQGHAFMGSHEAPEQPYGFGFRGRMDERYDLVRSVRNKRFIYIRNYMPHKIYGQYIQYMFVTPTTQKWRDMFDAGELNDVQSRFWQTKPYEELYDLEADPDEIHNLVGSSAHDAVLNELRTAHEEWVFRVRDVGFLPEHDLHNRMMGKTPYEIGHSDEIYPLKEIYAVANAAASMDLTQIPFLMDMLDADDSAIRYWAAMGLLMRGETGVEAATGKLRHITTNDPSMSVRAIAAEALGRYGDGQSVKIALNLLKDAANADEHGVYVSMLALNAIDAMGERAAAIKPTIESLPKNGPWSDGRKKAYVPNLITKILDDLDAAAEDK